MACRNLAPNSDSSELLTLLAAEVGKLRNEKNELFQRNRSLQSQVLELHCRNSNLNKHVERLTERLQEIESENSEKVVYQAKQKKTW